MGARRRQTQMEVVGLAIRMAWGWGTSGRDTLHLSVVAF